MPLAALLFAVTMWGLVPVALRFLLIDLSPGSVMILRLFPSGVIAAAVLVFIGMRPIARADWPRILIAALLGNVGYQVLAHFGIKTVPASWTGMLFGLEPVFIALFAVLLAGERMTAWLAAGILVALAGTAVLMFSSGFGGEASLLGLTLVALSTMGWGIYTVVLRPAAKKYGAFEMSCLTLAISAFPSLLFATPDLPRMLAALTPMQWSATGFLVIFGTFLAVVAWNYGVSRTTSSSAGMLLYVQPLVATIGGAALLQEALTLPLFVGGLLIIGGVALAQFGPSLHGRYAET